MKKFLAILGLIGALALGAVPSAQAAVQVLPQGCGSSNPKTGDNTTYVDLNGNLCVSATATNVSGSTVRIVNGTVAGSLAQRAARQTNVVDDFGADPLGTTSAHDSTTAFTSASNAVAAAGGGTVYVPPGAFWLSSPLPQTAGISWETQPGTTFPGPYAPPGIFYQYPFANNGQITPHSWSALLNNQIQAGDANGSFQFQGVQNGAGSANSAVLLGSFMHIANPYTGGASPSFVNFTFSTTFDPTATISPGGLWGGVVKTTIGSPAAVGTIDIGTTLIEFDLENYGNNAKSGGIPKYGLRPVAMGSVDSDYAVYPGSYGSPEWGVGVVYDSGNLRNYAWLGVNVGGPGSTNGANSWLDTSGNALFHSIQLGAATGGYVAGYTAPGPTISTAATAPSATANAGSITFVGGQTGSPTGAAYLNVSAGSGATWHQIATQGDSVTFSSVTAGGLTTSGALNAAVIAGARNLLDDGAGNATISGTLSGGVVNMTGAITTTNSLNGKTLALSTPVYSVSTTYTVGVTDSAIIANPTAAMVITLLSAATYPGREMIIKNTSAYAITSASANVVPITAVSPGSALVAAGPGKWVSLRSDGANWQVLMGN